MGGSVAFYADLKIMLPLMVAVGALLLAAATIGARWRNSEYRGPSLPIAYSGSLQALGVAGYSTERVQRPMKESQENQQNAETQRERYYATIHKVALQANAGPPDKIPGDSFSRYPCPVI